MGSSIEAPNIPNQDKFGSHGETEATKSAAKATDQAAGASSPTPASSSTLAIIEGGDALKISFRDNHVYAIAK
jgi:hypothetical protein